MEHLPRFQELLARARGGDGAATDELLALIRPWLEQMARSDGRRLGPDESVSDLVQEAWLRAWQKLDQFQGAGEEDAAVARFRAWLARIVSRLSLNAARDGAAQQRMPPGKLLRSTGPRDQPFGNFSSFLLICSYSSGVTSMMTEGNGMPLAGTASKRRGMIPDGIVFALTSSRLMGSFGPQLAPAVIVRISVIPGSKR